MKKLVKRIRLAYFYFLAAGAFFLIGLYGRIELDHLEKQSRIAASGTFFEEESSQTEALYIPTGKLLPYLSFGHDQLLADLLWLKTILYFGHHYVTDRNYPYLYHLLEIITDLDPRFAEPYLFGGIVLSMEGDAIEESNLILEKGMRNLPQNWRFPFFLGFNHWYYLDDRAQAAEYISMASRLDGAPPYLPRLAATLYSEVGRRDAALSFLRELYRQTRDERIRDQITKKLNKLIEEETSD